jgi:cyclase
MNITAMRYVRVGLLMLVLFGMSQTGRAQGRDFSQIEIQTTRHSDNFYTFDGQGGRIGALVGPDGVFLVDTQFAPLTEKIVAAVGEISDAPIRFAVNTHVHGDHTGGNANLANLGVTLMARDQLRQRMAEATGDNAPPPAALSTLTYDGPVTLHMNGEIIHLIPILSAHTDGDTLIYFENNNALMTGDYYRTNGYPNIDLNNGGSLEGMLAGLGETLGMAGPNTKVIPGHGPIVGRDGVQAHRDMLLGVRDRVAQLVAQGMTIEQVLAAGPTSAFDSQVPNSEGTSERIVRQLFSELGGGE